MKVTTEELERCEVLMTLEIEPQEEQNMLKKAAKKIARQVKIPGFRPGKAPYNVVVRRFGPEAIQQEALEQSVDKMIREALEDVDVEPYAQIQLESIDWNPLVIKVKIPTKPVIELGDYREVRLEAETVQVSDDEVEQALKNLQEKTATWTPVERPAKIDDLVSMSVVEKDEDEVLAQHESIEYELTLPQEHKEHNHPDLTTPLLGLEAGDEKTFTLTYPESYGDKQYAGKEITFEVEIFSVKEKEVESLDDEFAGAIGDFETLEELRADIEKNIWEQREKQNDTELGRKTLEQIIENAQIDWPLAFENKSVEEEIERYEKRLDAYSLSIDDLLRTQNKTKEEFAEDMRQQTIGSLKQSFALGKLAQLEKLEVSESEILAQAKRIADASGKGDEVWRDILASDTQQSRIANDLLIDKVIHRLAAIAKGEAPALDADTELSEPADEIETDGESSAVSGADEESSEVESDASEAAVDQDETGDDEPEEDESIEESTVAKSE